MSDKKVTVVWGNATCIVERSSRGINCHIQVAPNEWHIFEIPEKYLPLVRDGLQAFMRSVPPVDQ